MLAVGETTCDYTGKGSTGGAAPAEKVEIIAELSQSTGEKSLLRAG